MSSSKNDDHVLFELRRISKILLLANSVAIENEIAKFANSDTRQKMWILIDGKQMPKDIANTVGVTPAAVSYFLTALAAAGLIKYTQREPPEKILDYVPPSWVELLIKEKTEEEQASKRVPEQLNKEGDNH